MRIKTSCPVCTETNVIEFDNKVKPQEESLIPQPNKLNTVGVVQLSITHDDHTLIIDVDHEGNIRSTNTIPKIESIVVHYIATVANRIKMLVNTKTKIIIVSRSPLWKKFLLRLINLIFEEYDDETAILKITKKEFNLTFNDLTITYNDFNEFARGIDDDSVLILDQSLFNSDDIIRIVKANVLKIKGLGIALSHTLGDFRPDANIDQVDVLIRNYDLPSVQYMIPDLESVVLFILEILDSLFSLET